MATTVAEQQQITDRIIISSTFYTFVRKKKNREYIYISVIPSLQTMEHQLRPQPKNDWGRTKKKN